jgi:hypothetical protein
MQGPIKSIVAGVVSGIATYFASIAALGYTNALVMPSWAPLPLWDTVVVFGLGAALVALLIHFVALRIFQVGAAWAFASFLGATLFALVLTGQLTFGTKSLVAWLVGALLASLAYRGLRPNNSSKPTLLRNAA